MATTSAASLLLTKWYFGAFLHVIYLESMALLKPGSGPGGRRFKSSLPDQSNTTYYQPIRLFRTGLSAVAPTTPLAGGPPQVILEIDQAGKAMVVLEGSANTEFYCLYQSPDGQHGLLLEAIPAENNAWMVDNF